MADPGVARERTALAWQRTALSLVAGAAIIARLAIGEAGAFVLLPLTAAALLAAWVFVDGTARYRRSTREAATRPGRDARAPLCLVVAATLIATTELIMVFA